MPIYVNERVITFDILSSMESHLTNHNLSWNNYIGKSYDQSQPEMKHGAMVIDQSA